MGDTNTQTAMASTEETMPTEIDWTELTKYEKDDNTVGSQTLACSGDSCEVVDIT